MRISAKSVSYYFPSIGLRVSSDGFNDFRFSYSIKRTFNGWNFFYRKDEFNKPILAHLSITSLLKTGIDELEVK